MGTTSITTRRTREPLNWGFIGAMAFCALFWVAFGVLGYALVA
jgi:hypothetical protein